MKTKWDTIDLGHIAVSRGGSTNPAKFQCELFELYSIPAYDHGIPEIIAGKEIGSVKKNVEPNDVLLSRIVPHIQRVWIVGEKGANRQIASGEWIVYRSDRFYPPFLRYALLTKQFHSQYMKTISGVGGSLLRARPEQVAEIQIPLPPLPEQKRIAAILDKADAIRRKRRQAIKLADDFLRATFLDIFGDTVTNPKGWETAPLEEFGDVKTGNTPPRKKVNYYGYDIEWIKSDNINSPSHFLTPAAEGLSEEGKILARIIPAYSTLVTCIAGSRDCIGNAALTDREVAFNQQINAIVPNGDTDPYFLYFLIVNAKKVIQNASTNSMKGMVSKGKFEQISLFKPPSSLQRKFGSFFEEFITVGDKIRLSEKLNNDLFSSLTQRAFRGEL